MIQLEDYFQAGLDGVELGLKDDEVGVKVEDDSLGR